MDKFGIFKLLNSFLNLSTQNSKPQDERSSSNPSVNLPDLSALFGGSSKPEPAKKAPAQTTTPPLQASMLSTIRSHDEFVKRVKQNNKPCNSIKNRKLTETQR